MIQFNQSGVKIEWSYPNWFKRFLMRWKGLCAREHYTYSGYYCVHKRGHDGWCGCA